uniref:RING-type domain-containing protein n=1 Tax=Parascaris univalens TaxID=6257 RepID=A0A915AV89_PARUN
MASSGREMRVVAAFDANYLWHERPIEKVESCHHFVLSDPSSLKWCRSQMQYFVVQFFPKSMCSAFTNVSN